MASAALSSDHVNYLIYRYLQEAGHENAAIAFNRDWNRQSEYSEPENFPFAHVVRRGELVNVIQDGLHHDELIARVKRSNRKFHFTNAKARDALERTERDGSRAGLENGALETRPSSSSAKRKVRPPTMRPPDDFPTPAPKRQRRSDGSEAVHINGDAMEVDATSASADADDDGDVVSPTVASEAEILEVPERYDSMDAAVQTDVKTGPKTSTMYWKVDRPESTIYHSMFNPDPDPRNGRTLLTVGEQLCRFYQVPDANEDVRQIMSIDEPSLPPDAAVTASAWHPKGHTAAFATDISVKSSDGTETTEQKVFCHGRLTGTQSSFLCPPILRSAGIVLRLRYSPDGDHLLVVRTNLKRGLVLIYRTSPGEGNHWPVAWRITEHPVYDGAWTGDETLMICGQHNLVEHLHVNEVLPIPDTLFTNQTIPLVNLSRLPLNISERVEKWDKITIDGILDGNSDGSGGTYAVISIDEHQLIIGSTKPSETTVLPVHLVGDVSQTPDWGSLTAFAFRPCTHAPARGRALLAITFQDGTVQLYPDRVDWMANPTFRPLGHYHLTTGSSALALAWSPDGRYIAVGDHDSVQVWDVDGLVQYNPEDGHWKAVAGSSGEPIVTWRPDAGATKPRNGEHDDEDSQLSEPSLSWSADGERLGFAVDKQIAVMTFRPPLPRKTLDAGPETNGHIDMNGHASP